jgi:hypothetical protein
MELYSRLLYPFHLDTGDVEALSSSLRKLKIGRFENVWEQAEPHALYTEELLGNAGSFLFAGGAGNCCYLRLRDGVADAIFHHAVLLLDRKVPIAIDPRAGVELFLAAQGAGVLSFAFKMEFVGEDPAMAVEFNYRLSQLPQYNASELQIPHPADDPKRWGKIPEAKRAGIPLPPAKDAPLAQRLATAGGSFFLQELVDVILQPLNASGLAPIQPDFSVYTVLRLDSQTDMGEDAAQRVLGPILSGLTQVEERAHAGAVADDLPVVHLLLNRRHWAATGQIGSAHLIADQPPLPGQKIFPFNEERVARVFLKYFIPYLMALLQRVVLHRVCSAAGKMMQKGQEVPEFETLRLSLLQFSTQGHFTQVSTRDALHRYYQMARRGLDVDTAWNETTRTLGEIDAHQSARRQEKLARDTASSLQFMARTQHLIEWVEIFLVSVYAAHLYHMSVSGLQSHSAKWLHHPLVFLTIAFLGGAVTALLLKPWRKKIPEAK